MTTDQTWSIALPNLINGCWLFVTTDEHGDEGLPSVLLDDVRHPLIACDEKRVESLSAIAQEICDSTGQEIELRRLELSESVKVFKPKP